MLQYLNIIKSVVPAFKDEQIHETFSDAGIDSIDLVTIRVDFEKLIGKTIPDKEWISFKTFDDSIQYCLSSDNHNISTQKSNSDFEYQKDYLINMPQMAIGGLSENWIFKELGNAHWELLCSGLSTNSADLKDEIGGRLYATFVRIRIQSSHSFNEFNECENIDLTGTIKRYGNGMYFSHFNLNSDQSKILKAELMTSFSVRKSKGNMDLVKSQPYVESNQIQKFDEMPDFGSEYRLVKKNELNRIKSGNFIFQLEDKIIFQTEYNIIPYYDLNGVGLLYFAAYPIISDICEAQYFNLKHKDEGRWEECTFTLSRDIMYFSNCDLAETIIYQLNDYQVLDNNQIKIISSLYRKSDNQKMAVIMTVKKRDINELSA